MYRTFALIMLATVALQAHAKVDSAQAARLNTDLTPLGAERAGNAEGSIPSWTGGVVPPANYREGMHHPDPYAEDTVLYQISHEHAEQNASLLPEGLRELLKRNPDYYLRVFPTRRSASAPQRIYDATYNNALNAELVENGNGVTGAAAGVPFPIPQNGTEAIWNHILHYRGDQNHFINNQAVVINGNANLIRRDRQIYYV